MNRAGIYTAMAVGVLMAAGMMGCERQDSTDLPDPQVDGVLPHPQIAPDERILDVKTLYNKTVESSPAAAPATPAATPSAATGQAGVPKELTDVINQGVTLLEAGKYTDLVQAVTPPDDLKTANVDQLADQIKQQAVPYLAAFKEAQKITPTMKDDNNTAEYPQTDTHPALIFVHINDKWYVK